MLDVVLSHRRRCIVIYYGSLETHKTILQPSSSCSRRSNHSNSLQTSVTAKAASVLNPSKCVNVAVLLTKFFQGLMRKSATEIKRKCHSSCRWHSWGSHNLWELGVRRVPNSKSKWRPVEGNRFTARVEQACGCPVCTESQREAS